jgi:hypothetical protein
MTGWVMTERRRVVRNSMRVIREWGSRQLVLRSRHARTAEVEPVAGGVLEGRVVSHSRSRRRSRGGVWCMVEGRPQVCI